jgi:hypothetical protein
MEEAKTMPNTREAIRNATLYVVAGEAFTKLYIDGVSPRRDPAGKLILPELGKKNRTNEKARQMLDWAPRSHEEAIVAQPKARRGSGY